MGNILIVDDEPQLRQSFEKILTAGRPRREDRVQRRGGHRCGPGPKSRTW